jgi:DNA-binding NarL/FixJ family response regulator
LHNRRAKNRDGRLERIRVLLVDLTTMLRGVITEILATDPSIEVVGDVAATTSVLTAVEHSAAHVVICGTEDRDLSPVWRQVFRGHPDTKVVALLDDGQEAFLYELCPRREALGELSPQGLIAAVKRGATYAERGG